MVEPAMVSEKLTNPKASVTMRSLAARVENAGDL